VVDEYVFPQPDEPAKVGVKGRDNRRGRFDLRASDFTQPLPDLFHVLGGSIHLGDQADRPGNGLGKPRVLRVLLSKGLSRLHTLENVSMVWWIVHFSRDLQ
jgi:hypothetical protein